MPIVPALCTQCGAAVEVNDAQDAAICPHCRTPFIVEKAINHYHTTQNYQINGGVVNIHAGPSLEELYQNAKALILGGACVVPFVDKNYMSEDDKALHALYIKMLGMAPSDDLVNMTRAANAVAARFRSKVGETEAILQYLPLLREKDPAFYSALLDKLNRRLTKGTNAGAHYSGGLLGLKVMDLHKETVDRFLVPEEGMDVPFLLDRLYVMFWHEGSRRQPDHAYVCQKIYNALPAQWQQWIAAENFRREKIKAEVLSALGSGNFKLAYGLIEQASGRYPGMAALLSHFQKTFFSMKCTLSMDPALASSDKYYAPRVVHNALFSCPAAVREIENL